MTVKIISKTVKICSLIIYTKCFIREIFFKIVRMITEQISFFLIIPKILSGMVLTIANAKSKSLRRTELDINKFLLSISETTKRLIMLFNARGCSCWKRTISRFGQCI